MSSFYGIGDYIDVVCLEQHGPDTWAVVSDALPLDYTGWLRTRSPRLYRRDDRLEAWIVDVPSGARRWILSDYDFGRSPIVASQRDRYLDALRGVRHLIDESGPSLDTRPEQLSEFKGMVNRCLRKDQWDWFVLYDAFERPRAKQLTEVGRFASAARNALRDGDRETLANLLGNEALSQTLRVWCERAAKYIQAGNAALTWAMQMRPFEMSAADLGGVPPPTTEEARWVRRRMAELDRFYQQPDFLTALGSIQARLEAHDIPTFNSPLQPLIGQFGASVAAFEVRPTRPETEREEVREGITWLLSLRNVLLLAGAHLWLILAVPPEGDWLYDFLARKNEVIALAWIDGDTLGGPKADVLLRILERERSADQAASSARGLASMLTGEDRLRWLIRQGESDGLEFKSSLRAEPPNGEVMRELESAVVKTVAGFLNAYGGRLLIGVDDRGAVLGLELDYASSPKIGGQDGFQRHLLQLLCDHLGESVTGFVSVRIITLGGHDVCVVTCQPAASPVYDRLAKNDVAFWLRTGNGTRRLPVDETVRYVRSRWDLKEISEVTRPRSLSVEL